MFLILAFTFLATQLIGFVLMFENKDESLENELSLNIVFGLQFIISV
jgi:hypothetical protein